MRQRPEIILLVVTLLLLISGSVLLVIAGHRAAERIERLRLALPAYLRLDTKLDGRDLWGGKRRMTVERLLTDLGADAEGQVIHDRSGKTIVFFKMPDLVEVRLKEDASAAYHRHWDAEDKKARDLEKTNTVIRIRRSSVPEGIEYWIRP